ncbi:MAG: hypothetical protein WA941_04760 [Nitrososphaeraceae archaeon]
MTYVVTTIIDVVVIIVGIIVLAILFRTYIVISIVKLHSEKIVRKIKVSLSMLQRNNKRSNNQKSDRSSKQMSIRK